MQLSSLIIFPLIIIALVIASLFKSKKWQFIIIFLMTVFIVMELVAIYFSGGYIDYQFYVNLNVNDIIDGLFIFTSQAILVIGVFFVLVFLLTKLARLVRKKFHLSIRLVAALIALLSICYPNGPLRRLYEIYEVASAKKTDFQTALQSLSITDYPTKQQLTSQKGKNIIVLSLESFEQGFLTFKDLTPNLNQLADEYTFFAHMPMSTGSSWTTASMYTYMTGMPFLIGGFQTSPLKQAKSTQLISLPDVLKRAGYQTRYVMTHPEFAGLGHIANLLGNDIISEKNSAMADVPMSTFGLYDKDIIAIATAQIDDLKMSDKPFALFISTLSTHAPNGFYDKRMESIISTKDDTMSFAAASLDYNVGQFMSKLKSEGLLANTVFYIFPDHLMMGAGTPTLQKLAQKERQLYLLTNATVDDLQKSKEQTIYQIDLPRLILNGAGVVSNAKFLTDYLNNLDKKQFINEHKTEIAILNRSAEIR